MTCDAREGGAASQRTCVQQRGVIALHASRRHPIVSPRVSGRPREPARQLIPRRAASDCVAPPRSPVRPFRSAGFGRGHTFDFQLGSVWEGSHLRSSSGAVTPSISALGGVTPSIFSIDRFSKAPSAPSVRGHTFDRLRSRGGHSFERGSDLRFSALIALRENRTLDSPSVRSRIDGEATIIGGIVPVGRAR